MPGQIHVINPDLRVPTSTIDQDAPPTLEQLQALVGGYIEQVIGFNTFEGKPCIAYCNEEGKLLHMDLNMTACELWAKAAGRAGRHVGDLLVGNVIVLTGDEAFLA